MRQILWFAQEVFAFFHERSLCEEQSSHRIALFYILLHVSLFLLRLSYRSVAIWFASSHFFNNQQSTLHIQEEISTDRSLHWFSSMEFISEITDFICLTLFILGFIGNLLGIIVFSSRRFRCCSTYASLALSSFVINFMCTTRYSFLLYSQSRRWLSENFIGTSWLACKIFRFTSSFRVLAAWVTVFWVIERFIYVTARLHMVRSEQYQCARLKKFKYVLLVLIATIMFLIVTGPTVFFFSPNSNR